MRYPARPTNSRLPNTHEHEVTSLRLGPRVPGTTLRTVCLAINLSAYMHGRTRAASPAIEFSLPTRCPILIAQVHAAPVIKLSSRTVAVVHKSHLAKKSRRTGLRWDRAKNPLEVSDFSKSGACFIWAPFIPVRPGMFFFLFAARPRVRLSCAWDHRHAACAHACTPSAFTRRRRFFQLHSPSH